MSEADFFVFKRSNGRHDFYQEQLMKNALELSNFIGVRGRAALVREHKRLVTGANGQCLLRSLTRFDVGESFLFDSLHNLYLGLFVSKSIFPNCI